MAQPVKTDLFGSIGNTAAPNHKSKKHHSGFHKKGASNNVKRKRMR